MRHNVLVVRATKKAGGMRYVHYYAQCSCGWHGADRQTKGAAEEDVMEHDKLNEDNHESA